MPRPLPRRQSSSLPPPPKRGYTPYNDNAHVEADDYFQPRGRRSSTPGHFHGDTHRHRPESITSHNRNSNDSRRRPSSRGSYNRPSNTHRSYNPRDEEERGRHRYRPSRSTESHHRRGRPRSSSPSSLSSSPSTSCSSSTSSSLSSHHYGNSSARHHQRKKNYYPPSSSRQTHHQPPPPKRNPFNRLRSMSLPTPKGAHLKNPASVPPPKRTPSEIFLRAAQCAAEAGAVAALKLRDDPSPWLGPKGSKIAAAALSAAAVDTFMEQKHPNRKGGIRHTVMRQLTQMAIGNLVKVGDDGKGGGGKGGGGGGGGKGVRVGGGGGRRR